jgi:hypothetical protein
MHILGEGHDVAILRNPKTGHEDRYWAERGLVHVESSKDNSYETLTVREFLVRANGLSEMLGRAKDARERVTDHTTVERIQRFLEAAACVAQKAREQGEPLNPDTASDRKRRAPVSVVSPGLRHQF